MKTVAAVLVECGQPLELLDLELPRLQRGQVLVEMRNSSVCHTQVLEQRGARGEDHYLPHCLGHEGCGVVLETGPDVTRITAGDRVILSWIKAAGLDVGGCQYRSGSRLVNAGGVTTFGQHMVASENRVSTLSHPLPDELVPLLGCAIPTGVGSVWHAAALERGQVVAVFGTGGVGMCAVAAAATAGAAAVLAIDVSPAKLKLAATLGATHTLDASREPDLPAAIRSVLGREIDVAIEATGRPDVMNRALSAVRPRGGRVVVVGNARYGELWSLDPGQLNQGKRIIGTWGGDTQPDRDFPRYAEWLAAHQPEISSLLSQPYPLTRINDAMEDLAGGRVVRPLVDNRRLS